MLRKEKLGSGGTAFNPSTLEAEAGGFLSSEEFQVSQGYTEKTCLEKKIKGGGRGRRKRKRNPL